MKSKVNRKVIRLISIILVFVILLSSTMVTNASSFKKELIKVVSIANNNNYNNYVKDIENTTELLKSNCDNIFFTDENLNKKFNLNFDNCIVYAISFGKNIYIDTNYYNKNVVVHEMCHVYDYSNGWLSDSDDFQNLYKSENSNVSVSEGNKQNAYEFFASSGEMFFNNPEKLKNLSYLTYSYFNEIFSN